MTIRTGFIIIVLLLLSWCGILFSAPPESGMPSNFEEVLQVFVFMMAIIVAVLSALSLLIFMVEDFWKHRKNISLGFQILVWVLLLGLNWVGVIFYFLFIYYPRVKKEAVKV